MGVLGDVKKYVGLEDTNVGFNEEILAIINAQYSNFKLLGLTPPSTVDEFSAWPDHGDEVINNISKTLIKLRTKLVFDPSASANITKALESAAERLELSVMVLIEEAALP